MSDQQPPTPPGNPSSNATNMAAEPAELLKTINKLKRNLQEFRLAFTDIRFDMALAQMSDAEQLEAARNRLQAGQMLLTLDTLALNLIADALAADGPALQHAVAQLDDALDDLSNAARIITQVGAVLSLAGQIAALVP